MAIVRSREALVGARTQLINQTDLILCTEPPKRVSFLRVRIEA